MSLLLMIAGCERDGGRAVSHREKQARVGKARCKPSDVVAFRQCRGGTDHGARAAHRERSRERESAPEYR
jgi:hypothetical protein